MHVRRLLLVSFALVGLLPAAATRPADADACAGTPTFDASVPPPEVIAGFGDRPATSDELEAYARRVDAASDRVVTSTFARSWRGKEVPYALVGSSDSLRQLDAIAAGQRALRDPEATTPARAQEIAATLPAIAWFVGNAHPLEPSGGDAALRLLHHLAARTDCEVEAMLDDLVVGVVPSLNPDGRDGAHIRGNHYGFDLNRDFFALTQPESRGLVDLLRAYPPLLLLDAHETGGSGFYAPPSADPVFHEVPDAPLRWIGDHFGPRLRQEFAARRGDGPDVGNWVVQGPKGSSTYDLFFQGTLDTMATTAFNGAGVLFEKGIADPYRQRVEEQVVAAWVHLREAAAKKEQLLGDYYRAHVDARADGIAGRLEPNRVLNQTDFPVAPVPDLRVRHYFLPGEARHPDVARLVDRLLRFAVAVYRLEHDLPVGELRRHGGRPAAPGVVPAGSYWVPMAQPQKRWVQALLGDDTYTPLPIPTGNEALGSAWSNPLLMNLDASFTGDDLSPVGERLGVAPDGRLIGPVAAARAFSFPGDTGAAVAAAMALARDGAPVRRLSVDQADRGLTRGTFIIDAGPGVEAKLRQVAERYDVVVRAHPRSLPAGRLFTHPKIAVHTPTAMPSGYEECGCAVQDDSVGALRYLFDQVWNVPYVPVTAAEVAAGALTVGDVDVFVVTGANEDELLGAAAQVRAWVGAGGVFVGTGRGVPSVPATAPVGGTAFAAKTKLTSAALTPLGVRITGNLARVALDQTHPLTAGAGPFTYAYLVAGEHTLAPSSPAHTAARYPQAEAEFFYSGFIGATTNDRSAAFRAMNGGGVLVDEPVGGGRVVLFSGEPNFRASTEGMQLLLANAVSYRP